jgi:phosphoribosyl-ATP pyrophosphohydrolase/phosphoribosyl-AMP cyclohydrolase
LTKLENTIDSRWEEESSKSYINSLKNKGLNKIAQKVGEEAVEVVIEAKDDNMDLFLNESADLLFHLLVLFRAKKVKLEQVVEILNQRHVKS